MFNLHQRFFKKRSSPKKILLYGLQRSGTNYLETLINLNFPDCNFLNGESRNEITHKHFRLYDNKKMIPEPQFNNNLSFKNFPEFENKLPPNKIPELYIIVSKDPYSWFVSYRNWSKKNNWPNPDYHYIEEYNLFYGRWMHFAKESSKIIFVRYSDLLTQPLEVLNNIGKSLNLPPLLKLKSTKKVYASRRFTGDKKEQFLNKDHLNKITREDMEIINLTLDSELTKFLGYLGTEDIGRRTYDIGRMS